MYSEVTVKVWGILKKKRKGCGGKDGLWMFRSRPRERNDHTAYVRSREGTCGRFVPGTKLPSDFRALERTEWRERVTIIVRRCVLTASNKRILYCIVLYCSE